jgi:hypothetical protein
MHANAEVWGGLLWNLRAVLGEDETDGLAASLWQGLPRSSLGDVPLRTWFVAHLLQEALKVAPDDATRTAIRDIWTTRKFPVEQ